LLKQYLTLSSELIAGQKPEVSENINKIETGSLGLGAEDESAIVAFLKTLSDGYILKDKE